MGVAIVKFVIRLAKPPSTTFHVCAPSPATLLGRAPVPACLPPLIGRSGPLGSRVGAIIEPRVGVRPARPGLYGRPDEGLPRPAIEGRDDTFPLYRQPDARFGVEVGARSAAARIHGMEKRDYVTFEAKSRDEGRAGARCRRSALTSGGHIRSDQWAGRRYANDDEYHAGR
jgi:hypothetical protein